MLGTRQVNVRFVIPLALALLPRAVSPTRAHAAPAVHYGTQATP